ncbi:MAG: hypothetical protein ACRD6N_12365, partial [Pyrinomonadaceae bacterium]
MKTLLAVTLFAVIAAVTIMGAVQNSRHYGPFASTSPDSGTCGNSWATDTFDRHFHVTTTPNEDGTYTV